MFREEARRRLAFLLEHGWTEHAGDEIEYRTARTRLVFTLQPARGQGTHRIAGWFGHVGDRSLLPLEELHPMLGHNRYVTGDFASYVRALDGLPPLLLDHGRELLADRPGLVDEVRAAEAARRLEQGHDRARWAANAAFEAGDWATVVRELEPFEAVLRPSEKLKLDRARRASSRSTPPRG